jgi:hypothetical protein
MTFRVPYFDAHLLAWEAVASLTHRALGSPCSQTPASQASFVRQRLLGGGRCVSSARNPIAACPTVFSGSALFSYLEIKDLRGRR